MKTRTILDALQKAQARNMEVGQAIRAIQAAMRPLQALTPAARRSLGIYGLELAPALGRASAKTYRQFVRFDYELRRRLRREEQLAELYDKIGPAAGGAG